MTMQQFRDSLQNNEPPDGLAPLLQALWCDAKGDWQRAHEIAQNIDSRDAAWVHAYLHRKDGDTSNARYWYGQAGKPPSPGDIQGEWSEIVHQLLAIKFHT